MSHYRYHVFFCTHERETGQAACRGSAMREYAKRRVASLGLDADGRCRINSAGCLGRCEKGPLLVIYPQEVWYTYVDETDIDEIIEHHLLGDQIVDRLRQE
ncbi:MAG: (2Fe-2S) ferredoxin domain-containing protein [Betaproteobacteria bacterium]|nr:(2Fe-2S) ferredoxin domain-containing protein [Betaproteobacteria bacterium]